MQYQNNNPRIKQADSYIYGEPNPRHLPKCNKCDEVTKYRKPLCTAHIHNQPYAKNLELQLLRYEHELKQLQYNPDFEIEDDNLVLNDFLVILKYNLMGTATANRLSRDFHFEVVNRLIDYLVEKGLATDELSNRKVRRVILKK